MTRCQICDLGPDEAVDADAIEQGTRTFHTVRAVTIAISAAGVIRPIARVPRAGRVSDNMLVAGTPVPMSSNA